MQNRATKGQIAKVWQRVRPTVSKGDQQFQRENKSLAKGETNSFKGRAKVCEQRFGKG